jgi:hypothetical protein
VITNTQTGTNIHEISDGIYRINTPVATPGGDFSFNQYLLLDDKPMLFHTGPRRMFVLVQEAIAAAPTTLACMHSSAWQGDGGAMLRALAKSLETEQ